MASIVLVVPPNPFLNGYPSLGACHLASALLAAGHDVAVCDLGAPFPPAFWPMLTRALEEALLMADFFRYDEATVTLIRRICEARALHNEGTAARRARG